MLDFNEVFWHADKCRKKPENQEKVAENCGFRNFSCGHGTLRMEPTWTRRIVDANLQTWTCCVADADYLPTSNRDPKTTVAMSVTSAELSESRFILSTL